MVASSRLPHLGQIHQFPIQDLDVSGQIYILICMIHLMLPGGSRVNLHDLGQVWVMSELYRSYTTSHNGRLGSAVEGLDRDLSEVWRLQSRSFVAVVFL